MAIDCPVCEKGTLSSVTGVEEINHNGKVLKVYGFQLLQCSHCREEMVDMQRARENQRRVADACLEADGKLTTGDLKCFRMRHGLSQADAAALFGGGANAFSKYERGEVQQSRAMDLLIRAFDLVPEMKAFVLRQAGVVEQAQAWLPAAAESKHLSHVRPRPSSYAIDAAEDWMDTGLERVELKYGGR